MYKENLVTYFQQSTNSSKNVLTNSLKEYLVQENTEDEIKKCVPNGETKNSNRMFILLNVVYMITALLLLLAGAAGQFVYLLYALPSELKQTSIAWIISGVPLLSVSIFGIFGTCKDSTAWRTIYGILMMTAFVIHINVVFAGYYLMSEPESIARSSLHNFIYSSASYKPSAAAMNFIQESLQCCGVEGACDWENSCEYSLVSDYNNNNYYEPLPNKTSPKYETPQSCCIPGSNYLNSRCDQYFQNGCLSKMSELILQIVMAIFYVDVAVASVQVVGTISSFLFVVAKTIREKKSLEGVQV